MLDIPTPARTEPTPAQIQEMLDSMGLPYAPSSNQVGVFTFVKYGVGNAVINAVAGSGKSTTIVSAMKLVDRAAKLAFLAFNKKIVGELVDKIKDPTKRISTINSLGAAAIRKVYGKMQVDGRKYKRHIDQNLKTGVYKPTTRLEDAAFHIYAMNIKSLVDLYRVNLCMKDHELLAIIKKYDLMIIDNEVEIVMEALKWGYHNTQVVDFIDQIWFPVTKKTITQVMDKYDFIFIDECQDLSTCQRELVMRSLAPGGRFCAVGDPHQAIYGFAGADADSFETLCNMPNTVVLPLSVCYRCDEEIIDMAKDFVPEISARPGALPGKVNRAAKIEQIADGDMVVCRNTAPLVSLCMRYIANGTKAYVVGKDVGAGLVTLIENTRRYNMLDVFKKLEFDINYLKEKLIAKGCPEAEVEEDTTFMQMRDKIDAINSIAANEQSVQVVIDKINSIFEDDKMEGICLSTVHKAKGLESENVYIICEDKFFNKRAMRIDWMAVQEYNLVYVAYTRAKHLLGFVTDFRA